MSKCRGLYLQNRVQDPTLLTTSSATTLLQAIIRSPKDWFNNLLTGIPVIDLPLWLLPHTTARAMLLKSKIVYITPLTCLKPSNLFPSHSVKAKLLPSTIRHCTLRPPAAFLTSSSSLPSSSPSCYSAPNTQPLCSSFNLSPVSPLLSLCLEYLPDIFLASSLTTFMSLPR